MSIAYRGTVLEKEVRGVWIIGAIHLSKKYTNAVYPVRERKQTCKHIDYTMFQRKPPPLLVGQCRLILGQTLSYFNNFGRFFMKDVGLK